MFKINCPSLQPKGSMQSCRLTKHSNFPQAKPLDLSKCPAVPKTSLHRYYISSMTMIFQGAWNIRHSGEHDSVYILSHRRLVCWACTSSSLTVTCTDRLLIRWRRVRACKDVSSMSTCPVSLNDDRSCAKSGQERRNRCLHNFSSSFIPGCLEL